MKSFIVPLIKTKTGDTSDKGNYRPVAIVSACSKMFECVLLGLIEVYLCTSDNQFGFNSKHSTDLYIYLFILDPVGPMIQSHFQEKYTHSPQVAHRQCLLTLSHNLAWHIVQQSLHASQPDQLTRGPHSQLEERRLNTNKPHSYATTTRQTMRGPRQTMCRSHSPPTSPTATLHRKACQNIAPHSTGRTRVTQCSCKYPA